MNDNQTIKFVDLKAQYFSIKDEIDNAIKNVIDNTAFIMGENVTNFEKEFANVRPECASCCFTRTQPLRCHSPNKNSEQRRRGILFNQ